MNLFRSQNQFDSEEIGPHLLGVEELLQSHSLQELQVNSLGDAQRRFIRQGQTTKNVNPKELKLLEKSLDDLDRAYKE